MQNPSDTEPGCDAVCGGFTNPRAADAEVQNICDSVKSEVEKKMRRTYNTFKATTVQTQIVNGTNFIIVVFVGKETYLQLFVFQGSDDEPVLQHVKEFK